MDYLELTKIFMQNKMISYFSTGFGVNFKRSLKFPSLAGSENGSGTLGTFARIETVIIVQT